MTDISKVDMIRKIRNEYVLCKSRKKLEKDYSDFSNENPKIFDMICSENCDDNVLEQMLLSYNSMLRGEVSQHSASEKVGTVLVDKFVKPVIN